MAAYHVFIERAQDPAATAEVAAAIAARYGMPAGAIAERMARGRFRVKGNVELETAKRFAADLERLGAVCSIVEATAAAPPRPAANAPQMQSGLAAAFSGETSDQDLGILGGESGALSLATVDGEEEPAHEGSGSFAPPESSDGARDDLFAPPEAGEKDLELAVELHTPPPPEPPTEGPASPAPRSAPAPAPVAAPARAVGADEAAAADSGDSALTRARRALAGDARVNVTAGILLAVLLGFLPAHFVSAMRESSAYAEIDDEVRAEQAGVRTVEDWEALDEYRATQLDLKDSRRSTIAVGGAIIWVVCSGALGFAWFRAIDWSRWAD